LDLTGRRHPKSPVEAQISLFHWAAACLVQGRAGLGQLHQQCIDNAEVVNLRTSIEAAGDPTLQRDEAIAEVTLGNGMVLRAHVAHARGSIERPMTDAELDAKFNAQAITVLPSGASSKLLRLCRNVANLSSVGNEIASAWNAG